MTAAALVLLAVAVSGHAVLTARRVQDQPAVTIWAVCTALVLVLGAALAVYALTR